MVTGISEYGKTVKMRLLEKDMTQNELIALVKERTGLYFDSSYLHKVFTGVEKSPKVLNAINEILEL